MMTRALTKSVLGVAAPICLLAVAWVADRMYHHRSCRPAARAQMDAVVETEVDAKAVAPDLKLPELRRMLLAERDFYGWESSTPDQPEFLYEAGQFPRQRVLMLRIEQLSGVPLRDVIKLSPAERLQLHRDAAGCDGWRAATWLLHELDGAPLPRTARNRAKRIACEGPWFPGDPGQAD